MNTTCNSAIVFVAAGRGRAAAPPRLHATTHYRHRHRHRHLLLPSFFRAASASSRLWENDSCSSRSHTSHSLTHSLTRPACRHSVCLSVCLSVRGFQAVGVGSGGTRWRLVHVVLRTPTYGTTMIRPPSLLVHLLVYFSILIQYYSLSAPVSPFLIVHFPNKQQAHC